jgi:anti-anti-sigma factor
VPEQRHDDASLSVDVVASGSSRTVRVSGEVDLASSVLLRRAFRAIEAAGGDVTVDLSAVTFADTHLVHALTELQSEQSHHGGQLRIINVPPRVRRLFALAHYAEGLRDNAEDGQPSVAHAI